MGKCLYLNIFLNEYTFLINIFRLFKNFRIFQSFHLFLINTRIFLLFIKNVYYAYSSLFSPYVNIIHNFGMFFCFFQDIAILFNFESHISFFHIISCFMYPFYLPDQKLFYPISFFLGGNH